MNDPVFSTAAPHDGMSVFDKENCAISATFIGLDLTRSVFQDHGVDIDGNADVAGRGVGFLHQPGAVRG
jgi:hypothetical protein